MPITPAEVRMRFRNITVQLDPPNQPVKVSITKYACQHEGYGTGQAERLKYKDRLLIATRRDRMGLSNQEFVDVFTGKGTKLNIAKALCLAARHRIYFHEGRASGPRPGLDVKDGIQRVVQEYIGLDCNGFVGNWGMAAGLPGANPSRPIREWLTQGRLLSELSEIRPFDIIIWADFTHIAVTNDVMPHAPGATERSIEVVESSTGGIQPHKYRVQKMRSHGAPNERPKFVIRADIHRRSEVHFLRPNGI